jgi:predicted  nucleic acid-binding Zn-ribbon protein
MDEYWTELFEGLRQAGIGLQHTINGLQHAAEAARTAHAEHGDLRESIQRLEDLIFQQNDRITAQTEEIRALRARLDQGE